MLYLRKYFLGKYIWWGVGCGNVVFINCSDSSSFHSVFNDTFWQDEMKVVYSCNKCESSMYGKKFYYILSQFSVTGSFDQSPHLLDVYSNWTESTVEKQPRVSDDMEEDRIKETLADAMVESPMRDMEKLSLRQGRTMSAFKYQSYKQKHLLTFSKDFFFYYLEEIALKNIEIKDASIQHFLLLHSFLTFERETSSYFFSPL